MLRILAIAGLVLLPLVAFGHPVPADNHYGCIVVGPNGTPTPAPATVVVGALSYFEPKSPAASTIDCYSSPAPPPPYTWSYTGNEWASHADPCPPLGTASPVPPLGVYCGPMTGGVFRCWWSAVSATQPLMGLVVAVDVNLDGRITAADTAGPVHPAQVGPWVGEPLFQWTPTFPSGGIFGVANAPFPAGRILAFPTVGGNALDPTALFRIDCA